MSLKIKISKQSIASESRPAKRRIQRIESDEDIEADAYEPSYDPPAESRRKKSRTASRVASGESGDENYADADVEVDIDGDIEDTRFLPEPPPLQPPSPVETRRRLSSAGASSSKSRPKESKSSKSKSKKPRRQVVWTDDEDDEFDDPDVVVTDDDDFDPEPDYSGRKSGKGKAAKSASGKSNGRSKGAKEKEEKEITFRDERKLPSSIPARGSKPQDEPPKPALPHIPDPLEGLNLQPKRKLPPIKKNKPSTAGSTAPSTPSAAKSIPVTTVEKKDSHLTPAPTSNQVGTRKPAGASADLNLLDSSVYSELFKSAPGTSTPNSGLNRKQKEEERKRELNRMREEARAKREAEARNTFDLQAAPEKIERFVLTRLRHSTARFPNVLGAAFKEMHERGRPPPPTSEQR